MNIVLPPICSGTELLQPFNGLFSRTTWVSRYQKGKTNLDFTGARDSEWQWHQLGHMHVCPSCRPTNSVKALKAQTCVEFRRDIKALTLLVDTTSSGNIFHSWTARTEKKIWRKVTLRPRFTKYLADNLTIVLWSVFTLQRLYNRLYNRW